MSTRQTAWSKKSSSLPSDRIPSANPHTPKSAKAGNSKGKQKEAALPKSKEVRRLEKLRDGLSSLGDGVPTKDPKGGCFCMAREHKLSQHNPICRCCGLILCELNYPYHACPHCSTSLHTPTAREALIASFGQAIVDTLVKEEQERERVAEAARQAAGAFPTLGVAASLSSSSLGSLDAHPVNQPHKVLSLNSKTKKVTVSSFSQAQRTLNASVPKQTLAQLREAEPTRILPPPVEVPFSTKSQNTDRPWINLRGPQAVYKPVITALVTGSSKNTGTRSRKNTKRKTETGGGEASDSGRKENALALS